MTTDLQKIASNVAEWLSDAGYSSAFEAFNDADLSIDSKTELLSCYTTAALA